MSKREELFNEFIELKYSIQSLAGIVQNEGVTVTEDNLTEFNENVNRSINKLNRLKLDVLEFYK